MVRRFNNIQTKTEYKIRELLEPDERYISSVAGYEIRKKSNSTISPFRDIPLKMDKMVSVGLTNKSLIILSESTFGSSKEVKRIPIEHRCGAKYSSYRKGDRLTLFWEDDFMDLQVFKQFGQVAQKVAEVFNGAEITSQSRHYENVEHTKHSPLSATHESGKLNTRTLIIIWQGSGCGILILGVAIYSLVFSSNPPAAIFGTLMAISFFIIGMSGVTIIKRREFPGLFRLQGKWAILPGIFLALIPWAIALLMLSVALR